MKSKAARTECVQQPISMSLAKKNLNGGFIANVIHRVWSEWRRYQLIQELEHKRNDEHFLCDVGLTRAQVDEKLRQLRRQKPL
ncbi:hypothetical protein L4D06_06235 [Enterovibrio makurazakiensis]|uniref:DUF1127 domain-containing protein n=1 Tax=Enterovibrio gelatinilyticus TaxID=2899819 RepID=A0ABT5QX29_9GAMM|nr:hypothetical protein [Enterovibrio sp. ZSDZ42]MDD1792160.1 hypothetical protein [Enterovibrio sp. ZSDZ42]